MDETLVSGAAPPAPAPEIAPGARIGKYLILRVLGSGGMGTVWAARDPDLDREVAIKLLRSDKVSPVQQTRLMREARAMARLKHPNVLTVYEVDTDRDRDFIVMELVDGANLDEWLRERPPVGQVWDALMAAGRGLAAAHDAGLVHRDFKPQNVLRSRDGRVLVTDFGLARRHTDSDSGPEPAASDSVLDAQLTTTGQLLGTPAYMAAEQFDGEPPDPRTDQFAFCATVWEALTGKLAFPGRTLEELREQVKRGEPAPAKLDAAVRAVLVRGLSPDRTKRWLDMPAVLRALQRARGTRRRWLALALVGIVAGAVAGVLVLRGGHPAKSQESQGPACEPAETMFASAWSPAVRAEVLAKHPKATRATELASKIDAVGDTWLAGYTRACARPAPQRAAAVDCYLAERDELAVNIEAVQRYQDFPLAGLDGWELLTAPDRCAQDAPVTWPRLPDGDSRPRVIGFLADLKVDTTSSPQDLIQNQAKLREQAKSLAWPPLPGRVELAIATAARTQWGQQGLAHDRFRAAADLARSAHDLPGEALARLGVLETGAEDLGDELPQHAYDDELREADLAIQRAGNPPALRAELDVSRGLHASRVDEDLSAAIALEQSSYDVLRAIPDTRRLANAAASLSTDLVVRAGPGDLDHAGQIITDATRLVDAAPFQDIPDIRQTWSLWGSTMWVAWERGDLTTMHATLDHGIFGYQSGGRSRTGIVVDESGRPVANARVVAWTGDLFGDATRMYSDPGGSRMMLTTTDAHGAFTIREADGGGVMAELAGMRSVPTATRDGVRLTLLPTHAVSGTIDTGGDPATGIDAYVRINVSPTSSWFLSSAVAADGGFTLAGLPSVTGARLGAMGTSWPRELGRKVDGGPVADHAVIHWPMGVTEDVVTTAARGTVWVLRGDVAPKTRSDVERLARTGSDVATVSITSIGWTNTTVSALRSNFYLPGRHHALVRDIAPGQVTVCVAAEGSNGVACEPSTGSLELDQVRDRRRYSGSSSSSLDPPSADARSR